MEDRMIENDINIKKYVFIFLGVVFAVFVLIIIIIDGSRDGYLIIDESVIVTKDLFGYKQVEDIDNDVLKQKYTISGDFGLKKDVTINYSEAGDFTYFDNDYKDLGVSPDVSYTNKFKNVKVAKYDFEYYKSSDDEILRKVLGNKDINDFSNQVRKSMFDFDGDGKKETIYTLNNVDSDDLFSYMFMVRNGKVIKIADDDVYLVRNIIDIDGDGKYELMVSKGALDVITFDSYIQFYKINKDNVKCIMNCK